MTARLQASRIEPDDNNHKKSLEDHMRRFGFLLAVLTLVIFLSALLAPRPSLVHQGTAQHKGHPTISIGDIFRGY